MTLLVRDKDIKVAVNEADIIPTGTFGTICGSDVFLNLGYVDQCITCLDMSIEFAPDRCVLCDL